MKDIMIDLETLGIGPNAAILTIGACRFDIETGEIGAIFHAGVLPEHSMRQPAELYGDIDPATLAWWLKQPKVAQIDIIEMIQSDEAEPLDITLETMNEVLKISSTDMLWSNGATFDLVILRSAYARSGIKCPFEFWNERDVRTIVDMGRRLKNVDPKKEFQFEGTKHNALNDSIHQANYVSAVYRALKAD